VNLPEDKNAPPGALTRVVISKSIEVDVLEHPSGDFTTEDIIVVHCSPQSVFRVRPATRCSSTLSGLFLLLIVDTRGFLTS
jgi:ribosome assembly protein 4